MFDAPFMSGFMEVEKDWIDYNGHLNMAYYNVLFDRGVDQIWDQLGFGPDYLERTGCTTFSAEFHICYVREVHLGDRLRASFQLLDHDDKSFHFYQELIHEDGWISATGEGLGLHIDQSGPRVAAMPEPILTNVKALRAAHATLPRPDRVGRQMGIRHK
ncbi:thioesterase family protein [Shimia aestuarii]|uniref:Acyl-CoA thioester hydrolase n=1 Tax=Shimia aestuarii TaxID=254406 RepID=A0A1I4LTL0_9RHOB|nr:thioesterase family protein [Shimia aestuarii]SFL93927.1 acyl-CoA thioester hydrolase [Shimia aestuarii]